MLTLQNASHKGGAYMKISLKQGTILVCVGTSSSGKTTRLQALLEQHELTAAHIVSADACRLLVAGTTAEQTLVAPDHAHIQAERYHQISHAAFRLMHTLIETRASLNETTIVDATHLQAQHRKKIIAIAKRFHVPIEALYFDVPLQTLYERDATRAIPRGKARLSAQWEQLQLQRPLLAKEGFGAVHVLTDDTLHIMIEPPRNRIALGNGLDIIGDIHGCYDEFIALITKLGYQQHDSLYTHPKGRKLVSVGDIMSRGPHSIRTMQFWHKHIEAGLAYMTDSNHGYKIARWLSGNAVKLHHGDECVEAEFVRYEQQHGAKQTAALKQKLALMLHDAPSHYIVEQSGLPVAVVTHAGIYDRFIGKQSKRIADFCRYGDVQGEDERGKPIRGAWYEQHATLPLIIWGHEPKLQPFYAQNTVNIDQGVVFGGQLTAFCLPEETTVCVAAYKNYAGTDDNPIIEAKEARRTLADDAYFHDTRTITSTLAPIAPVDGTAMFHAHQQLRHAPTKQLFVAPHVCEPPRHPDKHATISDALRYYEKHGVSSFVAIPYETKRRVTLFLAKDTHIAKHIVYEETLGFLTKRSGEVLQADDAIQQLHAELVAKQYFTNFQTDFVVIDAYVHEEMPLRMTIVHILAHSGHVHIDKPHTWHIDMAQFLATNSRYFTAPDAYFFSSSDDVQDVENWLATHHAKKQGVVIKPLQIVTQKRQKVLHYALRIPFAAHAQTNESFPMRIALEQFLLGIEGLQRFVQHEGITRVYECAVAIHALEHIAQSH